MLLQYESWLTEVLSAAKVYVEDITSIFPSPDSIARDALDYPSKSSASSLPDQQAEKPAGLNLANLPLVHAALKKG
jgi:hypothetical protein